MNVSLIVPSFTPICLRSRLVHVTSFPVHRVRLSSTRSVTRVNRFTVRVSVISNLITHSNNEVMVQRVLRTPILNIRRISVNVTMRSRRPLNDLIMDSILSVTIIRGIRLTRNLGTLIISIVDVRVTKDLRRGPITNFFCFLRFTMHRVNFPITSNNTTLRDNGLGGRRQRRCPCFLSRLSGYVWCGGLCVLGVGVLNLLPIDLTFVNELDDKGEC